MPKTTWLDRLKSLDPRKLPTWVKWVAAPFILVGLVFYYRDKRVGDGYWGNKPQALEAGISARTDNYGRTKVTYVDGTELPADALSMAIVTKEDDAKSPEKLAPFKTFFTDGDWPLVVFLNATGFDPSGEPILIRRAADSKQLYKAGDYKRVALSVPRRDGSFLVHLTDGTSLEVSEKDWVEKFMRLSLAEHDPKELDKLSDEELRKLGYERIPIEDAIKKGLVDKEGKPLPPRVTFQDLFKDKAAPKEKK